MQPILQSAESTKHYTPDDLGRRVARILIKRCGNTIGDRWPIDPSCGDGGLLDALFSELEATGLRYEAAMLARRARGWDLDPKAVFACRQRLARWGCRPEQFECRDFLGLKWHEKAWDLVISNPPFLGGGKISGAMGDDYRRGLMASFPDWGGQADYAACFLRAAADGAMPGAVMTMIAPKALREGDSANGGYRVLKDAGWIIVEAWTGIPWPGKAKVLVDLVCWFRPQARGHRRPVMARSVRMRKKGEKQIGPEAQEAALRERFDRGEVPPQKAAASEAIDKAMVSAAVTLTAVLGEGSERELAKALDSLEMSRLWAQAGLTGRS